MSAPNLAAMIAAVRAELSVQVSLRYYREGRPEHLSHVAALRAALALLEALAEEPTPEMLAPYHGLYRTRVTANTARGIWKAMLAALLARTRDASDD